MMARPIINPGRAQRLPHELQTCPDPLTILSAIHFTPETSQEEYLERASAGAVDNLTSYRLIKESFEGINASSHWSMSRSEEGRIFQEDQAYVAHGIVLRMTGRLTVTQTFKDNVDLERIERMKKSGAGVDVNRRVNDAIAGATARAEYRIGQGLQDAALLLMEMGLLNESRLIKADTHKSNSRILIRDAIFAAEDLTISDMARLLWNVRANGNCDPGADPLIFVHCVAYGYSYDDDEWPEAVILEAVDFRNVENIRSILDHERDVSHEMMRRVQESMSARRADIFRNPPSLPIRLPRAPRR